ncbi:bifunctional NUDIX hydrolase/histidine phosphatase family protein [Corynebacterium alimapuense]|uniref:NTP pyrophosphohydrolase n=1 Tax=Corynebacterium alimapuense TaxID=1576874 RepID=A0A3M8K758_9CORY|nr:bifunctional NUDIX hydrolase/histidine phosphatase family protein [Corynebacterium alimapuense]RNE48328.1 NTP pyrophosphohydrolase [Corynebacterium alimapuense]
MAKQSKPHEIDKDQESALLVNGRHQIVPADPAKEYKRAILAAGAVLWRGDINNLDSLEIAVIHRPHYDDWSLAKGKIDSGESLPTTAAREIFEETGYQVRLGKLLGKVTYPILDRTKVVYYWTGEVQEGEFATNSEVDEIRWLPIAQARELLSYEVDRHVLDKAEKRFRCPATTRILYIRHGRAYQRRNWSGDDNLRPLDKKGRRQAEMLVPMLLPYQPTAIYSAEPDRCQATAAPLADELNLEVTVDPAFGDNVMREDMVAAKARFMEIVNAGGVSAVVSQGTAIPDMIAWLSANGTLPLDEIEAKKASVWVLSFNDGQLTGADYLVSPLPAK